MSARTDGVKFEPWQCALGAFFRSHFQFHNVSTPTDRATRTWWSQRHKYLTEEELSTCVDPGSTGDGGFRESAGNVGIGSEYIGSAGGGWGDSHTGDAEQSEAGGPAFADALAADANAADAVPHHEAQAQVQAQFPSGESLSFVAARAADAAIAAETAAVDAASDHASPAAASTAEGALAPAAILKGGSSDGARLCLLGARVEWNRQWQPLRCNGDLC